MRSFWIVVSVLAVAAFCILWFQAESRLNNYEGFNGFTMTNIPSDNVSYDKAGRGDGYLLYNKGVGAVTGGRDGLGYGLPDPSGLSISNGISPWGGGIGNGYNSMLRRLVWPTGPEAGGAAGAGPAFPRRVPLAVIATTNITDPLGLYITTEGFASGQVVQGTPFFSTNQVPVGDVSLIQGAMEQSVSNPIFVLSSSLVNPAMINRLKTSLAQSAQFYMNVTSDLPGVVYSFPLLYVTDDVDPTNNNVFAYTFGNPAVSVPGPIFAGARSLQFEVVQTPGQNLGGPVVPNTPQAFNNANLPIAAPKPNPVPSPSLAQPSPQAPLFNEASCGGLGYPSPDNTMRLYTRFECNTLGGNWLVDGECNYTGGGSWSKLCASQNNTAPAVNQAANSIVFQSPLVPIGDPGAGSFIKEVPQTSPAFIVNANLISESTINRMRTNMIVSDNYLVIITSDVPGATYKFPLSQITDLNDSVSGKIYAYILANPNVQKQKQIFAQAKKLGFEIILNNPLITDLTPATAQLGSPMSALPNPAPTPPNAISPNPPSTMASVIPGNTSQSAYQYMSQQPLLGAATMAQKIRNAEIMVQCNI